jgi:transcriptional regulator with XRE-family HTH domain
VPGIASTSHTQPPRPVRCDTDDVDRSGLASALKIARSRLSPADVGMPSGVHRRVAGLRREEVAMLAGISVDYLVRLEQGRGPTPSEQVLASIARALQLNDDERAHIFHLAGSSAPRPGFVNGMVRSSTQRVLDRMTDLPALVLDAKGDILAWNALAAALLGDFSAWPAGQRNVIWQKFLGTGPRRIALDPEEDERTAIESVSSLRGVTARYPDDPGVQRLLAELLAGSPRFVALWTEGRVGERRSSRKTVHHPMVGKITFDCDALHIPETDQQLIVYSTPPNSPEAEALALLRTIGLQEMHTTLA